MSAYNHDARMASMSDHDEAQADHEAGARLDAEVRDEGQHQEPFAAWTEHCARHGRYMAFAGGDLECPTCLRIEDDEAKDDRYWRRWPR